MLSRNFQLQKVGNLQWLKENYDFSNISFSIDELIMLDVSRESRDEKKFQEHLHILANECFVPVAAGGGICTLKDARALLRSGSDKVVVNSVIHENQHVIFEIAEEFGNQCLVASVDVKKHGDDYLIWTHSGGQKLELSLEEWFNIISGLPVGEVYLNSMDHDGTGQGYELDLLSSIPENFPIPIILAGGAGKYEHLAEGLLDDRVDAVATANLFAFMGDGLQKSRDFLKGQGIELPGWDIKQAKELSGVLINKDENSSDRL